MSLNIIANGGFITRYQPNTYSAVKSALDLKGCQGVYLQVLLSHDGVPVLAGEEELLYLTGVDKRIEEINWGQLQQQKLLKQYSFPYGDFRYPQSENISSLSRILKELGGVDFPIYLGIDTASNSKKSQKIAEKIVAQLKEKQLFSQIFLVSKRLGVLKSLQKANPELNVVPLVNGSGQLFSAFFHLHLRLLRFSAVWMGAKYLKRNLILLLKGKKMPIGLILDEQFTNEQPETVNMLKEHLLSLRVAQVITTFPERWVLRAVEKDLTAPSEKEKG